MTSASSRTNGDASPSLTTSATVTGSVRTSQIVAPARTAESKRDRAEHADAKSREAHDVPSLPPGSAHRLEPGHSPLTDRRADRFTF